MKKRFEGQDGERRLIQTLQDQDICRAHADIPARLAAVGKLHDFATGDELVRQGDADTDIYLVLLGRFNVIVNGAKVNERGSGVHLGEIAGLDAGEKRSATLIATEPGVVLRISDVEMRKLMDDYPRVAEIMLSVANKRLVERNALVAICNDKPHILIVSSKEALETAREVQSQFRNDDYVVRTWEHGVFSLSDYPIPSLERALDEADFAIVVAQPDDVIITRRRKKPVPRDNVTFEMGLAIGKLGLDRTIILLPSDKKTELASDTAGLTTARYRSADPPEAALGPACNDIRKHVRGLGVRRAKSAMLLTR